MEGARAELVYEHLAILPTADGGARRHSDLFGYLADPTVLLPVVGRGCAEWLVAVAVVVAETHLCCSCPLDGAVADTCSFVVADECGPGLLDIHAEAAWTVLPDHHRHSIGGGPVVGFPFHA